MTFLVQFFAWFGSTFFSSVVTFLTRKSGILAITLPAFAVLLYAMISAIKIIALGVLALAVLPSWLVSGVSMFIPSGFNFMISSLMSAKAIRWAYDIANAKLKMINGAN